MDSINEVMEAVKAYCKEKTSDATYAFYIKDIKAVSFENSKTVTLELRSDFVMGIVSDRYTALLQDAFKAILGFDVEIRYVVAPPEDGVKPGDSENQMDEKSLPSGRYEFTFENFIKPVCVCGRAGCCGQPLRRVQPAVHLRAVGLRQDPPFERHQDRDPEKPSGFQHCLCGL